MVLSLEYIVNVSIQFNSMDDIIDNRQTKCSCWNVLPWVLYCLWIKERGTNSNGKPAIQKCNIRCRPQKLKLKWIETIDVVFIFI